MVQPTAEMPEDYSYQDEPQYMEELKKKVEKLERNLDYKNSVIEKLESQVDILVSVIKEMAGRD